MYSNISIVIPARNEQVGLGKLLPVLTQKYREAEIIIVNDASEDETVSIAKQFAGVRIVTHPYRLGNGAAIKSGVRAATSEIVVFMDADGQHDPDDIPRLLQKLGEGYKMVVGARSLSSHASLPRRLANMFYNRLASIMTGYKIEDLTSGFRATYRKDFKRFLYLLPNGFSYPTTSTMAYFRSALPVGYVPIKASVRQGKKSHIKPFKDGLRFFVIILKVGALFSPMRLFLPVSVFLFATGLGYYAYTYMTSGRFTNMSALILLSSLFIFLMGFMAEFVSSLHYRDTQDRDD